LQMQRPCTVLTALRRRVLHPRSAMHDPNGGYPP
jgi:hypothetical protein